MVVVGSLPFGWEWLKMRRRIQPFADQLPDLLITVGGVSVGDHDLVRPALERAGVLLDFWKVAMKPGKPLAVGRRGACHVLGLPGNPASAMVTFALFGAPLLRAMQGDARPLPPPLRARLSQPIRRKGGRLEFVRAALEAKEAELWARPLANQASGAVTSMAWSDALIVVPGPTEFLEEGASVELLRLGDV
jgi:molybdopterin molybdotransferase